MRLATSWLLTSLASVGVQAGGTCPAIPPREPMPREAQPEFIGQPNWRSFVAALDAKLASLSLASRRLVFIGDSITASWDSAVFASSYGHRAPLLMGISGDYTQGVLYRLPIEWGALRPRLVVLLIGTNNTRFGNARPEDVALGIAEIVRLVHAKSADTRMLLLGILPIGATASEPVRAINAQVNALIARCADNDSVFYLDAGSALLDAGGNLSSALSFDMLHLTAQGYSVLARALEPWIQQIMGE